MGPGGSLGIVYGILVGWTTHAYIHTYIYIYIYIYIFIYLFIYFRVVGFFRIVPNHFNIGPNKLILFGMFKGVGLIGLIC